ncbi:hypothetical protein PE067_15885 [Paracoccus sp. DMF-8]|uniref:hypothetical protein n=1 Tax=Paracoccus sp. DMF-8 TaxID=3019445 RepID=UPI0023E426C6|nr:hypothetical protein [Paracoccus sp. DMF-8]MDF3607488.1 hypothetical protein [Paracoccus sp. DMF-8]
MRNSSHNANVEERLLAGIDLIDASQACALLRIETDDPEDAIQSMARDGVIITLVQNGKTMLPLFQFDVVNGRVFDVVRHILNLRPARISNLRLCYWLTRAHVDFDCAPADRLGREDAAIVAAFRRYVEPVRHG